MDLPHSKLMCREDTELMLRALGLASPSAINSAAIGMNEAQVCVGEPHLDLAESELSEKPQEGDASLSAP